MQAGYVQAPTTQGIPSQQAFATTPNASVFVKGLAKGVNERQLYAIFSAFGTVVDCQVARHRSGRSAGFAVVQFARREDATRALLVMESAVLAGRRLNVRWYTPELQHSNMGTLAALGDMNMAKALAAMLGTSAPSVSAGQATTAPVPPASMGDVNSALAQQLLMQQLASALAASQLHGGSMSGSSFLSTTSGDSWPGPLEAGISSVTSGLPSQHSGTPRMQPQAGLSDPTMADITAQCQGTWLDAGAANNGNHTLNAQLDSWARHSIDTSAPTYGPRRRSTQPGCRRSLEGTSLAACISAAAGSDNQTDGGSGSGSGGGNKWCSSSGLNRRASSVDCSLPTCSPLEQSEDGSCSSSGCGTVRRGSSSTHAPLPSTGLGPSHGVLHTQDSSAGAALPCGHAKSDVDGFSARMSSSSIQLPPSLDPDTLFEKPPLGVTTTPSKPGGGTATNPMGTPVADASRASSNRSSSTNAPGLRHSISNPLSVSGYAGLAHSDAACRVTGSKPNASGCRPPALPAPLFGGKDAGQGTLDLNAALNLSGLSLDGSPHVGGPLSTHLHMEAAMRQAREADSMIAQFNAMRSQALLAYHAAALLQHQGPTAFPAAGSNPGAGVGLQSMGQLPSSALNLLASPGGMNMSMGNPPTANSTAAPTTTGPVPACTPAQLESLMNATNIDLNSLQALVQLQQGLHGVY